MMDNIFKNQAYRLLLTSIKKEITEELKELQGDIIHLKDAAKRLRKFQLKLADRVGSYFNDTCDITGNRIRKIKKPYGGYTRIFFPRVNQFDKQFEEHLSQENITNRHQKRMELLKALVKEYFKNNYIKSEEHEIHKWTTDSRVLTIPLHSIDIYRFNAICTQTVHDNLVQTGDASDYVISCMYGELARINTWQYRSNKFLINEVEKVSLSSLMRTNFTKSHEEYINLSDDFEMSLNYPKNKHYSYGNFLSLEFDTNYKIPRLIGIECKKAAAENLKTLDNILGIEKITQ